MTSRKMATGRRSYMSKLVADAENIVSPIAKAGFLRDNALYRGHGAWNEDNRTDLMALVVVDDFPVTKINEILRMNTEETEEAYLWLADTYETIPDYDPANPSTEGTAGTIELSWRSPFIGTSLEEIAAFIRAAPKPPKPLCKDVFAVLRKAQDSGKEQVLVCHAHVLGSETPEEIRVQTVPCPVHLAGFFFYSYDRYNWDKAVSEQGLYYGHGASWNDDDSSTQVMALLVLDHFPTETIDRILEDNTEQCGHRRLWLADTYSALPDHRPNYKMIGTVGPITKNWRSPFAGSSIEEAANFIRDAPKPPKPLCKLFFAVLQKDIYERSGSVLICKIIPEDDDSDWECDSDDSEEELIARAEQKADLATRFKAAGKSIICKTSTSDSEFEVQMLRVEADQIGVFFIGGNRFTWKEMVDCSDVI